MSAAAGMAPAQASCSLRHPSRRRRQSLDAEVHLQLSGGQDREDPVLGLQSIDCYLWAVYIIILSSGFFVY